MKYLILKLMLLIVVGSFLASCEKQNGDSPFLTDENLTSCGPNRGCQYLFTEQADLMLPQLNFTSGEYRVFWYSSNLGALSNRLFIKAPMKSEFELNSQDILEGKVIFRQICPSCNMIELKPVGGFVKGRNTTPNKRSDQTKWLLEAKLFLEGVNQPLLKDTLYVKQYFYPNFVYN